MRKKVKILDRRFIPAGEMVIQQGHIGNRAFLIESGKVEVFMRDDHGRTVKIAEAGPGAIVGEMALITGAVRSASIRTLENTVLITISSKDIEETIGQPNGLFQHVMKLMAERLRDTNALLMRQRAELAEIEEEAKITVKNVSMHIPEGKQTAFREEVVPLLSRLKNTLQKYHDAG
ncbi:MAG: cyclic nucleotide-binding domain-containing protein [Alphaproteobacteria bacterium]|nr:cyclic nucleotide-binding domain-containing protein [Alphaproteobacteria bacterium]